MQYKPERRPVDLRDLDREELQETGHVLVAVAETFPGDSFLPYT